MIKSFFFSFFVVDMELFWILSIFRVGYYTGSFGHDHGLVVVQVSVDGGSDTYKLYYSYTFEFVLFMFFLRNMNTQFCIILRWQNVFTL